MQLPQQKPLATDSIGSPSRFTLISSAFAIAVGLLVLAGWTFDIAVIKSVVPGLIAMNPLTAICFILAGLSLRLQQHPELSRKALAARVLATTIILLSAMRLGDYFWGLGLGVDRILFASSLDENSMAPNTALCFSLVGLSLLFLDWTPHNKFWPAQIPAIVLAMVSLVCLTGYAYGASGMYRVGSYIPMALHTAIVFHILSIGILFSRPGRGLASVIVNPGPGGSVARRLLPICILVPAILGWLRVLGQRAGFYDMEVGAAIMVAVTAVLFCVAVCWISIMLNRVDRARQLAADELAHKNDQIRDLYDNAPCGYHSIDPNGYFQAINKTELAWLGYTADEVVGKLRFVDVITPAGRAVFDVNFAKFKANGSVSDLAFDFVCKDGSILPVVLNATAVYDNEGNYVGSRTTVSDARERRRVETAYQTFNTELENRVAERTAELKTANADLLEKSQENEMFVYSVSHDLRSPLVNLQGFSQELTSVLGHLRDLITTNALPADTEKQAVGLIDDDMQQCIRFIQTSVSRLSGIIDALLRLSRAGRIVLEPQANDTDETINRIIESMAAVIHEKAVDVKIHPLPSVWGDPTAIEQIFANLIGNAVNYLDAKRPGKIEIGVAANKPEANSTVYFVKDNGLGIPEAYHNKIFQALKRVHPDVARGEGIGLTLVKRMVERHGGAIWFESVANEGTTFYARFPKHSAVIHREPPPQTQTEQRHDAQSLGYSLSGR